MSLKRELGVKMFVDQDGINRFVNAVERKKGYKKEFNAVFRHLVSEIAELDAAVHCLDRIKVGDSYLPEKFIHDELVDILFLTCYIAEIFGIDINLAAGPRMKEIAEKYGVKKEDWDGR